MTNQVDTSAEAVTKGWEELGQQLEQTKKRDPKETGVDWGQDEEGNTVASVRSEDGPEGSQEAQPPVDPLKRVRDAEMVIYGTLKLMMARKLPDLKDEEIREFSRVWAECVCHYYEGGIFEFLEYWKPALLAAYGTMVFGVAVADAAKLKQERDAAEKAKDVSPTAEAANAG